MKRLKLITFILILIIILQGIWRNTMDIEYIYSMEKNIGKLEKHIKPYERDILNLVYFRVKSMEEKRVSREEPLMRTDEENLRIHFNSQLNQLTNKYLLDEEIDEYYEEVDISQDDLRLKIISNILNFVDEEDREELNRASDLYMETRRSFYIDSMIDILRVYENINTNLLMIQLQDPINIHGFFKTSPQLQYMDMEPSAISSSNSDEIALYEEAWNEITRVFPNNIIRSIDGLIIYSGNKGINQPYIRQGELGNYNLYLNKDEAFTEGGLSPDFYKGVLNEIGLLIATRPGQAEYRERPSMTRYFQNGMLATQDSYLNQFYVRYWEALKNDGQMSKKLGFADGTYLFYLRHENQFVSPQAAVGPMEDFARTLSYFVFEEKPNGNEIQDQKIRFFYEFPELTSIRNYIRDNLEI